MKKLKMIWDSAWAWICAPLIKWLNHRLEQNENDPLANNAANVITGLRGLAMTFLVPGLVMAAASQRDWWLSAIFAVQLTDGADGAVARGTETEGELGSALDGAVDKYSAVLLTGGLIAWIRPEFELVALVFLAALLIVIVIAEILCVRENKWRQEIYREMESKFSSRLPAQIKFGVSMLILGSCWLAADPTVAASIFLWGLPVIAVLTIWSAWDYHCDRQVLQHKSSGSKSD